MAMLPHAMDTISTYGTSFSGLKLKLVFMLRINLPPSEHFLLTILILRYCIKTAIKPTEITGFKLINPL